LATEEEAIHEKWQKNPMTKPKIMKLTVNISVGKSGEPLEKASSILKSLTDQEATHRKAKKTIKDWGLRKGEPVSCIVTLRGEKAHDFLRKAFTAVGNKLSKRAFDREGNFAFGIREHLELPGVRYEPELGIVGMDLSVTMGKPGYRIQNRGRFTSKVGDKHKVTAQESTVYLKETFGIEIVGATKVEE
jgi:large subunit ribosomal protein L5